MKKSKINVMDTEYLISVGFDQSKIKIIESMLAEGRKHKLYKSYFPYHDLNHAKRVIMYAMRITNELKLENITIHNEILLYKSCLYHDCGRNWNIFSNHGKTGAKKAQKLLEETLNEKELNIIKILIEMHANKSDKIDFSNFSFNEKERKNIELMLNILKDADALDRDRIKLFPFAWCKERYLRTTPAKNIFCKGESFYNKC